MEKVEFTESDKVLIASEKEPSKEYTKRTKEYRIGELPRNDFQFFVNMLVFCGCLVVPMFLTHFFGGWGVLSILGMFFIPWHSLINWYANA